MLLKPIYLFLLNLYFIFLVFSENLGQVFIDEAVRPILFFLFGTGLFLAVFIKALRNTDKAAFVTAAILVSIFIFPNLEDLFSPMRRLHLLALLIFGYLLLFITLAAVLHTVKNWHNINQVLNTMVSVMLVLVLYRIGSYALIDNGYLMRIAHQPREVNTEGFKRPEGTLPDIYYIILDAYAREDTLRDYYGYDNSEFIIFLKKKGFQVAHNSVANYNMTVFSVGSALNYDYAVDREIISEKELKGWWRAHEDIYNNKVTAILGRLGYRIITVRSESYMHIHGAEDYSLGDYAVKEGNFETALFETTLLPRLLNLKAKQILKDRERVDYVLEEVSRQASGDRPLFLAAHIMAPHQPYIYNRNGGIPDFRKLVMEKKNRVDANVVAYADQVHYLNILLRKLINDILEKSETPPVIILQGDHGFRITWNSREPLSDRSQLENLCLRDQFTNLNALYIPDKNGKAKFYNTISPVNTFRLIFDTYFGSELGMLEDRTFYATLNPDYQPVTFMEVTGLQNTCSTKWTNRLMGLH